MAVSAGELEQDENERNTLLKTIADVESTGIDSTLGTRSPIMENFLQNAKVRLANLEKRIKDKTDELESQQRGQQVAIAS